MAIGGIKAIGGAYQRSEAPKLPKKQAINFELGTAQKAPKGNAPQKEASSQEVVEKDSKADAPQKEIKGRDAKADVARKEVESWSSVIELPSQKEVKARDAKADVARKEVESWSSIIDIPQKEASQKEVVGWSPIIAVPQREAAFEPFLNDAQDSKEADERSSKEAVKQAVDKINKNANSSKAVFGIHEATNRVTIKIVDRDTDKVIKELPPEKTLDMIAKVWELAGLMIDERG
ncbi:flagellar protein FlaG [Lachnospiraceae bacterium ZAX-1]